MNKIGLLRMTTVTMLFALGSQLAMAQTRTWSGGGGNANSGNLSNWLEGAPAINTSYDVVYDPINLTGTFRTVTSYNTTGFGFSSLTLKGNASYPGFGLIGTTATTLNGPITVVSGSHNFNVTSTVTTDSTWDIADGAQLKLGSAAPSLTVAADKTITKTGEGNLYMEGSQTGIAGTIKLEAGTVTAQASTSMGTASLQLNAGTLALVRDSGTIYGNNATVGGDVTITSGRVTAGTGSGVNQVLGSLGMGAQTLTVATGNLVENGSARVTFGNTTLSGNAVFNVTNNVAAVATRLTLGAVAGDGQSLAKTGNGELVLSGVNTYSGTTTVNAGLLVIDGDSSAATGAITVNAGATLGGSGRIGGATTVHGGLKPGNSPGTLTFDSSLSLGETSTTTFEIAGLTLFDSLANDGGDTIGFVDGATIAFDTTGYMANVGDSFLVLDNWSGYAGTLGNLVFSGTDLGDGKSLDTSSFLVNGTVTVIPEPATLGLLAASFFGMVALRRFLSMG